MNKKIVVFGATGNLGTYIAIHMKEQGYDVIAVGHRNSDNIFLWIMEYLIIQLILKNRNLLILFHLMMYMRWLILQVHSLHVMSLTR